MKKILLFSLCLMAFSCSTSHEQKIIFEHMKNNLGDIKSYEVIENLEPIIYYSRLDESLELFAIKQKKDSLERIIPIRRNDVDEFYRIYKANGKFGKEFSDSHWDLRCMKIDLEATEKKIDSLRTNYIPKEIGYEIMQKFRAKNKNGGTVIEEFYFVFNLDKTKLIKVYPKNNYTDFSSLIYHDVFSLGL